MYLSIELERNDSIFNSFHTLETDRKTVNDYRYNNCLFKTYCFKTFRNDCYSIVDGVPFLIPYENSFYELKKKLPFVDEDESGVFIIKTYTYRKIQDIEVLKRYWETGDDGMPEDIVKKIKEVVSYIAGTNNPNTTIKYRIVDFISYTDLCRHDRYNRLINGTISLNIKEKYDYMHHDNTLSFELKGSGETKWITIGDKVIPLITNKRYKEDKVRVQHSNSKVEEFVIHKDDNILYDTYNEAGMNTVTTNLKIDKINIEKNKIILEEKKLIMEHKSNIAKHEQTMFSIDINYKTDILKAVTAANSLEGSVLGLEKARQENLFKGLFNGISLFEKLVTKKGK